MGKWSNSEVTVVALHCETKGSVLCPSKCRWNDYHISSSLHHTHKHSVRVVLLLLLLSQFFVCVREKVGGELIHLCKNIVGKDAVLLLVAP